MAGNKLVKICKGLDAMSKNINLNIQGVLFFLTLSLIVILPDTAYAQTALFDSGTNFLTALQDLLTNTWARIIAIIAICGLGILWMTGRLAWGVAASIIGGIILIFGAPAIVDSISGNL